MVERRVDAGNLSQALGKYSYDVKYDLSSFRMHLAAVATALTKATPAALEEVGRMVEKEAKEAMGQDNWEPGAPFVTPWEDLTDKTKHYKEEHGFAGRVTEFDTNLRTGRVRASIKHKVENNRVIIGSDNHVMEYIELGTRYMAPRSVLGGALNRKHRSAAKLLGTRLLSELVGRQVADGAVPIRRR